MTNESENLSAEDRHLAAMLNALPRAEAPADFDHKVRGRIAARRQHSGSGWRIFVPAFAAVFLVALGAVLYLGVLSSADVTDVPPIADAPAPAMQPQSLPQTTAQTLQETTEVANAVNDERPAPQESITERIASPQRRPERRPQRNDQDEGSGSVDRAGSPVTANPDRPVNSNVSVPDMRPPGFEGGGQVDSNEVLSLMGLRGNFQADGFLVSNAEASGAAARAGVRTGDVVESLDGKRIEPETRFASGSAIKTISVRRGDERLVLRINP
jgi:C-terminal processing protease CtpA/Prc